MCIYRYTLQSICQHMQPNQLYLHKLLFKSLCSTFLSRFSAFCLCILWWLLQLCHLSCQFWSQQLHAFDSYNTHQKQKTVGHSRHTWQLNGYVPAEPRSLRCPINFLCFMFQKLCILSGQTKTFYILLNTIPPNLP